MVRAHVVLLSGSGGRGCLFPATLVEDRVVGFLDVLDVNLIVIDAHHGQSVRHLILQT